MSDNSIKPSDTFGVIKSPTTSSSSEPDARGAAKSASSGGTFLDRALQAAGLKGAAREARKGSDEIARSAAGQPTPERAVGAAILQASETGRKVLAAGAKDIGSKVVEKTKAIHEPYTREVDEARRETGAAAKEFGKGWVDSLNPFDEKNVRDKVDDQPTLERKIFWGGVMGAQNLFNDRVENVKNAGNLVKEYGEGVGETFLHNPFFNLQREGWSTGIDALNGIGGNAKDGYVSAMKTKAETDDRIDDRSDAQAEENSEEIAGAAGGLVRGFGSLLDPMSGVDEASGDQPTPERGFVAGGVQLFSNLHNGSRDVTLGTLNLAKEGVEAEIENTITDAKNLKDEITGGFSSAGSFAKGLFGGD